MKEEKNIAYLDYNATTPVDPRVLEDMIPYFTESFANSSSSHHFGNVVGEKVKSARGQIADFINADPSELIFTSGATEAINIALKGVAQNYTSQGKHILTVSTEHKAVIDTCKDLERKGFEVTYLPVKNNGLVDIEAFKDALRSDTILVSVMYINNETGVIQRIKELSALAHTNGSLFMTDATQAVGKIEVDVDDLDVDLLCFSGHKMYAAKGIGALFVRNRKRKVALDPQIHGGGHEQGLRSGTLNVPAVISLAKACEISKEEMKSNEEKISELRDELETQLLKFKIASVVGEKSRRIFNTTNICFQGEDASVLIARMRSVAVSNGSACSSAVIEPSHVLRAMGLSDEDAFSCLRFSLGKYNTSEDIQTVVNNLKEIIE
jgi:cysteine desulfurase